MRRVRGQIQGAGQNSTSRVRFVSGVKNGQGVFTQVTRRPNFGREAKNGLDRFLMLSAGC